MCWGLGLRGGLSGRSRRWDGGPGCHVWRLLGRPSVGVPGPVWLWPAYTWPECDGRRPGVCLKSRRS